MDQVPKNSVTNDSFGTIMGICLSWGIGLGTSLGAGYGLIIGFLFGLIIGFLTGIIGGFMIALAIYAWRIWLSPRNISDFHLCWLTPILLSLCYIGIWYPLESHLPFIIYMGDVLISVVKPDNDTTILMAWPSVIMSITIVIALPKVLRRTSMIEEEQA